MKKPALSLLILLLSVGVQAQEKVYDNYLPIIFETEQWIKQASVDQKQGKSWLWCPDSLHLQDYQAINLYHGSAGVVLFYVELFGATKNEF